MKAVFKVLAIIFFAHFGWPATEEVGIGQEYIKSIRYPKISPSFDYSFLRSARFLGERDISTRIDNTWGAGLAFDVGLLKYLNAGAGFSLTTGNGSKPYQPYQTRFTVFAKPLIPINERLTFFGRFGGGLSVLVQSPLLHFQMIGADSFKHKLEETYGDQDYAFFSPGGNILATVGVEYFPFSRFGLALEWGLRADLYYVPQTKLLENFMGKKTAKKNAPSSIKYLSFDLPLILTLHVIL